MLVVKIMQWVKVRRLCGFEESCEGLFLKGLMVMVSFKGMKIMF